MAALYETFSTEQHHVVDFSSWTDGDPLSASAEQLRRALHAATDENDEIATAHAALRELTERLASERAARLRVEREVERYRQHLGDLTSLLDQL